MGPYLGKPKTKILFTDKENERFIYCTAEMQGWRSTQEVGHYLIINLLIFCFLGCSCGPIKL